MIDRFFADTRYGAVVSASQLANELGVSVSTVTRAAQTLGFAGYPHLQSVLRERFVLGGSLPERIGRKTAGLGDTPESVALQVMLEDSQSVRATAEDLSQHEIPRVVDALIKARRVYVFGSRSSSGIAQMLVIGLRLLMPRVTLISQTAGDLPDQLLDLARGDAVMAVSFRRVDRVTVNVLRYAEKAGACPIAVTDHIASAIARSARYTLLVRESPLRVMPSFAAAASLVNGLITAVSIRQRAASKQRLQLAETLWKQFATYAES